MIAGERPKGLRLLVTLRGSILGDIAFPLAVVVGVAILVTLTHGSLFGLKLHMDVAVFGMLGTVLAIILGFRTNASYDRYREGRMLWGELLASIRSFSRALSGYLRDPRFHKEGPERRLVCGLLALPHLLRHELRGTDARQDVAPWISRELSEAVLATRFPASSLLDQLSRELHSLALDGRISEFARVALEQDLSFIQRQLNGCDRLQTTPIPFAYSLLVHRTISVYLLLLPFGVVDSCGGMTPVVSFMLAYTFFGLEAVGTQIEEPFGLLPNDLPLTALCRGLEIDLAPLLGHEAPPALLPVKGVLA
jgi:ion channel-forming bestrophin family protein